MNKEKLMIKHLILLYLLKIKDSSNLDAAKKASKFDRVLRTPSPRLRRISMEGKWLLKVYEYLSATISLPACPAVALREGGPCSQPNFFVNNPG